MPWQRTTGGAAGSSGGNSTGTIVGRVDQLDEYGDKYSSGLNTTTVNVDGSTLTAVTDDSGTFTFTGFAAGVYDFSYSKPGCGLSKTQQVAFPGSGILHISGNVIDKPSFAINTAVVKDTSNLSVGHYIKMSVGVTTPMNKARQCIVIFGKSVNMTPDDVSSYVTHRYVFLPGGSTAFQATATYDTDFSSFSSGSTVYAKMYPATFSYSSYMDLATGKSVFTDIGTAFPITFAFTRP